MPQLIQIKRGLSTSTSWPSLVLEAGEPAFLTDTKKFYIGDGTSNILINPTYGTAANANTGTSSGNVPVLDSNGKLPSSVMPPIAIGDTFVVSSQAAMLALTAQIGDIAVRTDVSMTYILQAEPASSLANWVQLMFANAVASVNGLTGSVVLNGSNVNMTGYTMGSAASSVIATDSINAAIGKVEYKDSLKAPLVSPTFTGTPAAPTALAGTNTTQIATTAFVQSAIAVVDGGTF